VFEGTVMEFQFVVQLLSSVVSLFLFLCRSRGGVCFDGIRQARDRERVCVQAWMESQKLSEKESQNLIITEAEINFSFWAFFWQFHDWI
jgi:hypothetical protein